MSAPNKTAFTSWAQSLPIPFLVGGPNGQAETTTWPALMDTYTAQLIAARYCAFPDLAPVDALSHLGGDRQLIQGAAESNASFQARLKDVWGQWSRAGTFASVLEQLYYFGLTNAVIVQQNGLEFALSSAPTPGQDPTSLVTVTNAPTLAVPVTSTSQPGRQVSVGNPWFSLGNDSSYTNQFAVIVPSWPFSALALATFNGADAATVTWPIPFGAGVSYGVSIAPASDVVTLYADGTTQTGTGITVRASSPWTGTAWVAAYGSGVNPLNTFGSTSFGQLQKLIATFRPNAICTGVFAVATGGRTWDYFPSGTTWDGGTYATWDTNTTSTILSAF